jgi:hypothetical protein
MRSALGWVLLALGSAAFSQTSAPPPDTATYTNPELHFTFEYPAELHAMNPQDLPGASRTARFSNDPDVGTNDNLESGQCSKRLLTVGETGAGPEGKAWASISLVEIEPDCIPPKALKSRHRMDLTLMPLVHSGTQVLGMMPMGPAVQYPVQNHRIYMSAAQGQPIQAGDLQTLQGPESVAILATQVQDRIVSWRIETNSMHLLNRILAGRVDFGAGAPQVLFPGRLGGDTAF